MIREKKRLLALLLCLCMVMALQPSGVFALDTDSAPDVTIKGRAVELTGGEGTKDSPYTGSIYYAGSYFRANDVEASAGTVTVYKDEFENRATKDQAFDNRNSFLYVTVEAKEGTHYYKISIIPNNMNITVNGVDVETETGNHTAKCGDGEAVFNPAAQTLTLKNATIKGNGTASGMIDIGAGKDLEIILIGENEIVATGKTVTGIYVRDGRKVTISGEEGASLVLRSENNDGIQAYNDLSINNVQMEIYCSTYSAIKAYKNLTINNARITGNAGQSFIQSKDNLNIFESTIEAETADDVTVWATNGSMVVNHSKLNVRSERVYAVRSGTKMQIVNGSDVTAIGIWAAVSSGMDLEINDSVIDAQGQDKGKDHSNGIYCGGSLYIQNSLKVSAKGTNPAIWAKSDAKIGKSNVYADSAESDGICVTEGKLEITDGSIVESKGITAALYAKNGIAIDNSKVEADAVGDTAIYTKGKLSVNGELSASGKSTSYGAVCVRAMTDNKEPNQEPADDPTGIITLGGNYADSNGAAVASSDWKFSQSWYKDFYFAKDGSPAPEVNITAKTPSTPSIPSDYLASERVKAVKDVTEYVNPADYDDTEKEAIKTIISDAKTEIYRAGTKAEIATAVATAKEKLDSLQTAKQKEEAARLQRIKKGVEATKIKLSSGLLRKGILLKWTKSKGFKMDYYEVFRSTKRYSGFGKKAFFTTKDGSAKSYTNTKGLKKGRRYYYKVRGVRILDGETCYTGYSNKAWRTMKK